MLIANNSMLPDLFAAIGAIFLFPYFIFAHCDTMDGPVVSAARVALEKGDVTPVLKWVRKEDESEIREAFKNTLQARKEGPEAKKIAERYFFETLVRVHRAGEGAPYTGLKPKGYPIDKSIIEADEALERGDVDELVKIMLSEVEKGIRSRFSLAQAKKKYSEKSVDNGREFIASYVDYVHFVEELHNQVSGSSDHHHEH